MGLLEEGPRATGSTEAETSARIVRSTQAGEEELQRIQKVVQLQNQQASAADSPQAAPVPLTGRMRTRRLATQALTLCCANASHQVAQQVCDILALLIQCCISLLGAAGVPDWLAFDVVVCRCAAQACIQVAKGRKNLEDMCDDMECSAQLPEAFRTLLPCVAWEASICDIGPEALREHQVDVVLWTCLKQSIIALARGTSNLNYLDMKHSGEFIAAKREWCRRANITSAAERMQSALTEGQIQAVAVQKQQSKAKVSTVLWGSSPFTLRGLQDSQGPVSPQVAPCRLRLLSRS